MPWKGEKDVYKIWLSEIILQQTRVDQGLEYYNRFVAQFPTIQQLAQASQEEVYKMWEGLGYYTRARNLHHTARYIFNELNGRFPDTYEGILNLKGIGPYTAAAIASFGFGLPHAVVDGNVFRVLSRYFADDTPTDTTAGKKHYEALADKLLWTDNPGVYNQAIMDFGAMVCKPQLPLCNECVLMTQCKAFANGMVNQLPIKEKRLIKKKRFFNYFVILKDDEVYVHNRSGKDIWQHLNEFYLMESDKQLKWSKPQVLEWVRQQLGNGPASVEAISHVYTQLLTHQTIHAQFITIHFGGNVPGLTPVPIHDLRSLAFPRIINQYLDESVFFVVK